MQAMEYREMMAKYPGTCRACGGSIGVGARIMWAQGAGARHVDCSARTVTVTPSGSSTRCGCGRTKKPQYATCYQCAHPGSDPDERPYGLAYRESGSCGSCGGPYGFDHC